MLIKYNPYIFLVFIIVTACDWGRTPSKERFEKNCHITIPQDATVIKDDYNGMVSNYAIYYTLKFTSDDLNRFKKSLMSSDYYSSYWHKSKNGYNFYKKIGEKEFTEYSIELDTAAKIASFTEMAN